jgi:putative ABC transport system permease protein
LKDGGHGATSGERGTRVSALLVVAEVALAVVLLVGAGVMMRSFLNIYGKDLGVDMANILSAQVGLPIKRYPRAESQLSFFDRLTTRLSAIPGVESVALVSVIPTLNGRRMPYDLASVEPVAEQRRPTVPVLTITPNYFGTLGAAVRSGRAFNDADGGSGVPVAIVNQRFANEHWPGKDPLSKRLRLFTGTTPDAWLTVVGIVSNIVQNDLTRQEFAPVVYIPYRQQPLNAMSVLARTRVAPEAFRPMFSREFHALDSDLTWNGPFPLSDWLRFTYWTYGTNGALFLVFAAIALVLASVGLYAVVVYSMARRTQELGIRMAIGATARDIFMLVVRQGMLPVGVGLAVGVAASLAVTPLLKSVLVHVSPADPVTYAVASAMLIVSASLGCWLPARRAVRVDPVIALRYE